MKIFYMVGGLNPGGSEHQTVSMALQFQAKGHHITVGCLRAEGSYAATLAQARIPIVEFSPGRTLLGPGAVRGIYELARFLRRGKFALIHTHDLYSNLMGIPAGRLARVPLVISSQRDLGNWSWYTPRNRRVLRWIHGLSHVIVANSEAVRAYLVTENRIDPEKIWVLRNAVDCDRFACGQTRRDEILPGCRADETPVAMVANMHFLSKGHNDLIEAAEAICCELPSTKFVLVGDGENRALLEEIVDRKGLRAHFTFVGARTDVPEILTCCSIGVLPSHSEGLPNAVLEYMAAGLPVVASGVGGIPEVVQHGVTGLLVPPRNPPELAKAILDLLRDPVVRRRMGTAGRLEVQRRFSLRRLMEDLELVYGVGTAANSRAADQREADSAKITAGGVQ